MKMSVLTIMSFAYDSNLSLQERAALGKEIAESSTHRLSSSLSLKIGRLV